MKRVFVSYSRQNLESVQKLVHDLNAIGVDTWHDQTLTGEQRWWDNILENIRQCEVFISALSPESPESEACKSELAYVEKLGKTILPVVVADGVNKNLLPHPLSEIQVIDCLRDDKESVFALVKCIMSSPAAKPLPDPLPEVPPVPFSYLSSLNDRIESAEPLTSQDQITLIFELEEELRDGRSPTEVRDLLLRLKRRDDLLAKIATKIDEALKGLESLDKKTIKRPTPDDDDGKHPPGRAAFCAQCGTELEAGSRFCQSCGARQGEKVDANRSDLANAPTGGSKVPVIAGSKTRRYTCTPADSTRIIADVKRWLESQDFDCQQMNTDHDGLLLQIKKRGQWRDWVGMSTALNIVFHQDDDVLVVQIGAGKWIDKVAAGTVSLFILWPLAIAAGWGAWEQAKMPEKVFDFIGSRLAYK